MEEMEEVEEAVLMPRPKERERLEREITEELRQTLARVQEAAGLEPLDKLTKAPQVLREELV